MIYFWCPPPDLLKVNLPDLNPSILWALLGLISVIQTVQSGESPVCNVYSSGLPSSFFLFLYKNLLVLSPILSICFPLLYHVKIWSPLSVRFWDLRWRKYLKWNSESHAGILSFWKRRKRFGDSVQFSSVTQSCPTLSVLPGRTPGLPVHHQLPEFTQTHVHRVGDAIQPSHPLSSPSPPAPNPSQSALRMRWPKYWSFSLSISPSKEHPGLVSFRVDWLDLLPVQGTFETLLQYHN